MAATLTETATPLIGAGYADRTLTDDEVAGIVGAALARPDLDGRRTLAIVPDGTRTAPIDRLFRLIHGALAARVPALDFLIALGTHQPLSPEQIDRRFGVTPAEWAGEFRDVRVFNHEWDRPETFVTLGTIPADEVAAISGGRLRRTVDVRVNRLVLDYDQLIVCGPVFPHEVVGFSGGNKYFFPGISGPEVIDLSHWLGALITSAAIIGTPGVTPVRRLIDRAASLIPTPKLCFSLVVAPGTTRLAGLYFSAPEASWAAAADLSAQIHVRYVDHPFRQVLSVMPPMYDDIWTAAKGMYKVEPVVADGGAVIIYAPHITEFSYTHGPLLAEIGYHVRDYFTGQWERFATYPGGVLAHSTHLRGGGAYDPVAGERPRIRVTLVTGISPERCAAHNLGYRDPATIDPADFAGREDEGILLVPHAGEMLYRLRPPAGR
ncbi:MAG TPA: lactate racemase domain-containing protein [Thermomicrobiales bacterium]|nr:lactate racemase domain-containing protein [Thermomicrobiales bacterium]